MSHDWYVEKQIPFVYNCQDNAWTSYIKMEMRYKETDRARQVCLCQLASFAP